jgi:hypothetical protein
VDPVSKTIGLSTLLCGEMIDRGLLSVPCPSFNIKIIFFFFYLSFLFFFFVYIIYYFNIKRWTGDGHSPQSIISLLCVSQCLQYLPVSLMAPLGYSAFLSVAAVGYLSLSHTHTHIYDQENAALREKKAQKVNPRTTNRKL